MLISLSIRYLHLVLHSLRETEKGHSREAECIRNCLGAIQTTVALICNVRLARSSSKTIQFAPVERKISIDVNVCSYACVCVSGCAVSDEGNGPIHSGGV